MPVDNDGDRSLTELISSLLDRIPNLLRFKSKWSSIRAKLADLNTHLSDLPASPSSNQLSLDLLASLRETLHDAASVAARCEGPDLSEGKLKTQSDVDSVTARLDRHVKDAEVLIKSGLLLNGTVSSKKEAAARNLVIRLQIGGAESKSSAIDSLLRGDDKDVMVSVAQGVVPVLVRLLDSCSGSSTKEKILAMISRISTLDESSKHVLVAEGLSLLNHLLRVVESGSGFAKENACVALQALSSLSKENARAIGCRGGISSLLEICQGGTPASQALAAGVLRNLASFGETKESFVEEKAVFVLVSLGSSGTALARENAVGCLASLASGDEDMMMLIVREGGVKCLKSFWDSVSDDAKSIEVGVVLLKSLALCSIVREVIISEGFIPRLVPVLSCGVLGVRIAAAEAVSALGLSSKSRNEIGESGCISALIDMLDGKAVEEKEAASKALSTLLVCTSNRKIFKRSDKGVLSLVQLLDPKITKLDKRYTVSALELLVTSKKCRKQVVAAGACLRLQKLVEMDVEGAKKLAENLSRSKIWGAFARP